MPTSCPFVGPMVGLELAIASSRTKPIKINKTEKINKNPGLDILCNSGKLSKKEVTTPVRLNSEYFPTLKLAITSKLRKKITNQKRS